MKARFMDIKDKKIISKTRKCPAHHLPHKLPFTEPVRDEACHIHEKRWRMCHHVPFCKIVNCRNYGFMIKEYEKEKKKDH